MNCIKLFLLAFLLFGSNCGHPIDAEVRDQFVSNKDKFIQLKNMLDTDWYVVRLDNEDVFYANDS